MSKNQEKILRLILGDQLNSKHSWFRKTDPSVEYLLMEMRQETDYVRHHIQKVCAFFAAMRQFADWLRSRGHRVHYLRLDDRSNRQDLSDNIRHLINDKRYTRFEYLLPDEYRLDRQLVGLSESLDVECRAVDSEHFLTSRDEVGKFFANRKQWRMESFYRHMRHKYDILLTSGKPVGGRWNFDAENRGKYRGQVPLPSEKLFKNNVEEIVSLLKRCGVDTFGSIDGTGLVWPVNRRQALSVLSHFIKHGLPYFGTYQDAMAIESRSLFHSRLSFALNTKMLHPMEVIERAVEARDKNGNKIGLPQVEGFVRQMLGWREYVRGVYWKHMPQLGEMNYFGHRADLPRYYWDGMTNMKCMAECIGQSLEGAYAHHIQRLMVTGNFALLAGADPGQVDAWYLGVYIDALEWVEMPNTRGMSQFADGGITASKPYVSTANYIHGQSDYCGSCHYDRKKKYGEGACPFNSLHWNFYNRHRRQLERNPRLATMYRVWNNMDSKERDKILKQAAAYQKIINDL